MSDEYVYTPEDFLGWAIQSGWTPGTLPIGVVFTFQAPVTRALVESGKFEENRELTVSNATMLMTSDDEVPVLIACLNPGAVAMATQLEHLRFLGDETRYAAAVGTAGALTADYLIGETVLIHSALRSDAVSNAYLAPSVHVDADPELTAALERRMPGVATARTWTVSVPYRSTRSDLEAAIEGGASLVEMEVASLFAVGQRLGISAAAALIVSDVARVDGWEVDWSDTTGPTVHAVTAAVNAMRDLVENS
ncbi:MAG: hypothetical protein HKN91_03115 [Acidimicrobiia bacterium]|nr:hypothetical protein [Acidimicrobiia bacterium]